MSALSYLVTGGAGFIGSHVCDRLIAEGHDVVALDNFFTGSRQNLEHLRSQSQFRLVEHDVCEPLPEMNQRFDRVLNLACPASPVHYQRDPVFTIRTNVLGTIHGLELAKAHGARFLQASTSEVYGDPEIHPQTESYRGSVSPTGPRACYDEGKRCSETLCFDYHRQHDVAIRVARIFNTYGPRMAFDDGRVVSNFIGQALRGEDITVYGDGLQTRSFCYVDDLVTGLLKLVEHPSETGPINLGNPEEYTIAELAQQIIDAIGADVSIVHAPLPEDDPKRRLPDITKARAVLDFEPVTPWRAGMTRTIEHFRQRSTS